MYYLLIEKFNNYNNRFLKRFDTIQEYVDYCTENSLEYSLNTSKDTNFNKKDNIHASHVFNENLDPSYLIWFDKTSGDIVSRWFVIHYTHLSGSQFMAELKRDLLADNKDEILESPCYIEKGYVEATDPAIYNKEDVLLNQIKTSETLLKDDSHTAWIVGYIAQDHQALSDKTFTLNPKVDMTVSGNFNDWQYASWCDGAEHKNIDLNSPNRFEFAIENVFVLTKSYGVIFRYGKDYHYAFDASGQDMNDRWWCNTRNQGWALKDSDWWSDISLNTTIEKLELDNPSWCPNSVYNTLYSLIGKKIQFDDGVYELSLNYNIEQQGRAWCSLESNLYTYLYNNVNNQLSTKFGSNISGVIHYPVSYRIYLNKFRIVANKIENVQGTYKYSLPQTTRKLNDAPYKMFCIPYYTGDKRYTFSLDGSTFKYIYKEIQMAWAMSLAKELGASLYDLQILPYCPISNWRGLISSIRDGIWTMDKTVNVDYIELIDASDSTKIRGYCSFCDVSSKEQFLNYPIEVQDPKIENQCDMYRVCSPNYASVFEFSAVTNGGVEGFNVRYTYKPYQPFINVAPKFGGLYGIDFKDNRGLILSGDFSLPVVTDAWVNYQLNNKNYLLAFDRQIETLELQQDWQFKQGLANAITGTLKGGTTGGMAGGMVGGPWGAVAGAVVGTVASGVGGVMDLTMQKELQRDAKDFAKDNFKMNLQNIHALPNTLNKVSSLVVTSKLFPFIEFYTCTDTEREAFRNKLKYNGYTIERIGVIKDFLNRSDITFIKAKLIRNKTITCSADELLEIANELNKGVFIE